MIEEALRKAIRLNPHDDTPRLVYADWLDESGQPEDAARIRKLIQLRIAREDRLVRAADLIKHSAAARKVARSPFNVPPSVPIEVVPGRGKPELTGDPPFHTFKKGGWCDNPAAAMKAGYKVQYHRCTRRITVGADWLLRAMKEWKFR